MSGPAVLHVGPAGAALVLALLGLSACQPQAPDGAPAPAPADAPAAAISPTPTAGTTTDFSGDIDARGTEPFWGLKLRGTQFTLSQLGQPDVVATAPGATIRPGQGAWTATTADGRTLQVTLFLSPCSDGMSDNAYPMTAEVRLGDVSLNGCAGAPRPGPQA